MFLNKSTSQITKKREIELRRRMIAVAAMSVSAMTLAKPASAYDFQTNSGWNIDWSNTLKLTDAFRVVGKNDQLSNPNAASPSCNGCLYVLNGNDGDNSFHKGLISNRVDWLTEVQISKDGYGFRGSAAAWYDSVYNQRNSNDEPLNEYNSLTSPVNQFNSDTKHIMGLDAEMEDAFVYGKVPLPNDTNAVVRVGRHTVLWGESLFNTANGIAAGQAPIDDIKALGVPGTSAKELFMPVGQISTVIPISDNYTVEAYDQFEWRPNRLPAAGSYFSELSDYAGDGAESILLPSTFGPFAATYTRLPDITPKTDHPQFGVSLTANFPDQNLDLGLYVLRWDAKAPEGEVHNGLLPSLAALPSPAGFQLLYPENIWTYGASFDTGVGPAEVGGEASFRNNMPLVEALPLSAPGYGGNTTATSTYPIGQSLHAQVSVVTLIPAFRPLWQGANLAAEVAGDHLVRVTKNGGSAPTVPGANFIGGGVIPGSSDTTGEITELLTLQYFQVLPKLDLSVPLLLSYNWGNSKINSGAINGGEASIGLDGTYNSAWRVSLHYNRFISGRGIYNGQGGENLPYPYADRDNISLSVQRSF